MVQHHTAVLVLIVLCCILPGAAAVRLFRNPNGDFSHFRIQMAVSFL
jgi:hypothetical protein